MPTSVLIVDDEASIAFALEQLMRTEGHEVQSAQNGLEALEKIGCIHPDLVLLDISLPDRDGYAICQAIRSLNGAVETKIILMSARSREFELEKAMAVGADACLAKPFSIELATQTVRQILKKHCERHANA